MFTTADASLSLRQRHARRPYPGSLARAVLGGAAAALEVLLGTSVQELAGRG